MELFALRAAFLEDPGHGVCYGAIAKWAGAQGQGQGLG